MAKISEEGARFLSAGDPGEAQAVGGEPEKGGDVGQDERLQEVEAER